MVREEKEFMTLEEAATYVGKKRASVYNYIKDLNIKTHKFGRDRHAYIALADVKRIKEAIEKPWTIDLANKTEGSAA